MKKNWLMSPPVWRSHKIVMIMKLLVLFNLCFLLTLSANSLSQIKVIDLQMKDANLKDVLDKIEEKSNVAFFYQYESIEVYNKVSITCKEAHLSTVLDQILNNTDLTYKMMDNYVAIIRKTNAIGNDANIQQQQITVKGIVTDDKGEPLPGVNVYQKSNPSNGGITGIDGSFSVNVNDTEAKLVFSFIGFVAQEVNVAGRTNINITLSEETKGLEEVVVVGYGTQKIKDVTGSLSHIGSEAIEERPVVQLTDALAGRAAGVQVTMPSGKPQGGASVIIRGITSLGASSDPLYVVDGVPTRTLYDINPNDIENISILKDASAAAIYGSTAANGVVIISTKRGTDDKGVISFNTYYGISRVTKEQGTLNSLEYIDLMDELGLTTDWSQYNENTDWQDEIYRDAVRQNYQLSVAGNEKGTNYYASVNWQANEGIIRSSLAERTSAKINIDKDVNEWLKMGASVMYSSWYDVEVSENVGKGNGSPVTGALITPELIGVFNEDGTYTGNPLATDWENPVSTTDAAERGYRSKRFLGSGYLEAKIIDGLKFKTRFSVDDMFGKYTYYLDNYKTDAGRAKNGLASESRNENSLWLSENLLNYNKNFGNHKLDLMGGGIFSKESTYSFSSDVSSFDTDIIKNINAGTIIDGVSTSELHKSNVAFIGRLNYAFKDKYLFTSNFRADASSNFGANNRWAYFPSLSAGWRISEESFMEGMDFIDDLKLRLGWGMVGEDRIGYHAYYGLTGSGYDYVLGERIVGGIAAETIENPDLKWETTTQSDIGLDMTFLNHRINLVIDVYQKNTSDILLPAKVPTSSGYNTAIQNIGETQNKGLEVSLGGDIIKGHAFNWTSNFNISFNKNKVVYLKDQEINDGYISQRGNVVKIVEGEELFNFWGFVSDGVDTETGDMIYKDLDGDEVITTDGDMMVIGNANPDFTYGFTNTLSYKGLSLNVFIHGSQGNDIFNASRILTEGMNDHKSQSDAVLRRWRQPGDMTDIPRATTAGGPDGEPKYNSMISSRFIEDGSYLKIKTITLAYEFNKSLLEKVNISSAKVYVTGENLFTFTDYSGYDPEVNSFGGLVRGVDYGAYPHAKSVIFGLNLSF